MSFLLRVVLPDKPGSLGALATALGNAGADILGVDVVERSHGHAVDDLAVELPPGRPAGRADHRGGVGAGRGGRVGAAALGAAGHPPRAGAHRRDQPASRRRASRCSPTGCRGSSGPGWALVAVREGTRSYRLAESAAAPETRAGDLPWLPLRRAVVLDPDRHWVPEPWRELDTELAAAPFGPSAQVLVVGRPGGPAFRPSELARLTHLAGIVTTVLGG